MNPKVEFSSAGIESDWSQIPVKSPPLSIVQKLRTLQIAVLCTLGRFVFGTFSLIRSYKKDRHTDPLRILVVRRGGIGDVIMLTPLLRALKAQFPEATVDLLVSRQAMNVLKRNPFARCIIEAPTGARNWLYLMREIRANRYDTAFVLHRFFAASVITAFCGIPRRVGFYWRNHGFALTSGLPYDVRRSQAQQICELMGLLGRPIPSPEPEIFVSDIDEREADQVLKNIDMDLTIPLVGIHPGGAVVFGRSGYLNGIEERAPVGASYPPRKWFPDRFANLADRLLDDGLQVLILQGPGDEKAVADMRSAMRHAPSGIAPQMNLLSFAALLKRCDLVIASDSGPMHVATAVGTKVLGVFGPTHAGNLVQIGTNTRIAWAGVPCSPCIDPDEFALSSSWLGKKRLNCWRGSVDCMKQLHVETTHRIAMELLHAQRNKLTATGTAVVYSGAAK